MTAGDPGGSESGVYTTRRRRSGSSGPIPPWVWAVVVLVLLGGGAWWWIRSSDPGPAPTTATTGTGSDAETEEPEITLNVPPLDESDPVLRELLARLSNAPGWARWLVPDDLARRFVVTVVNVAQGESPRDQADFLEPEGPFEVVEVDDALVIAPESFGRYDLAVATFLSLDVDQSVRYYRLLQPLFEEAYAELGFPDRTFNQVLSAAVHNLLEVPIPDGEVAVVPDESVYAFADPTLESLTPADKHLLRLGPENGRAVQGKLDEFARALGLR